MALLAGVDGCRGGWIAALFDTSRPECPPMVRVLPRFDDLFADAVPDIVAVDMPIGLPERVQGSGRGPEQLVRPLLGARQSSVFAIPARCAVEAADYAEACARALAASDPPRKVSKQGFHLFPKIREIDRLLRGEPALSERVFEIHPELAFRMMRGATLAHPKKIKGVVNPAGLCERRGLLVAAGIPAATAEARPPRGAAGDDLLDALAALVVARHIAAGRGRPFPDPPGRDSHGLPVAIWTFASSPQPAQDSVMSVSPVTRPMIEEAAGRIAGHARVTPVMRLGAGALGTKADVSLKLECLQHAGSFKTRGAFNNLLSLPVPAAGVSAASGGNHGAAVAYAAMKRGVKATIFVPEISPAAKIDAIRRFGADVVVGGAQYDDAQAACDRFVAETGALKIHPFAAMETIAGQGTLGREWDLQEPDLDTVLVAVGGGGLISGIASWFAGSKVKVVGVEPEGSRALQAAFEAKGPVEVKVASVAADSLGARNVGQLVYDVTKDSVARIALVPDAAITEAQALLWRDFRLAVEPGGAAALAALLCGAYEPAAGERLGVLVCGANVDLTKLAAIAG
ncbi:Threonine dehydratase OS=Bosea thiooxidans OX=53254 GN=SAMN05660750_00769 PE=4 SV=1 [Bosea thiooxidans]|uniref:Threonine dehydratase n=2 Tax=Bosea thiooxidans TaxID=53254 RepID=A0A1T5BEV9_9HYPH|nr:Threonine dehydratase [Bosea thiooxidans]